MIEASQHLIQCQRVLRALGTASTRNERISVLKYATTMFDHQETRIHDLEVEAGIIEALNAHLEHALSDDDHKQAERLCKLLSFVFQCSNEAAASSFCKVGGTLVPQLFELMSQREKQGGIEFKYAHRVLQRLSLVEVSIPLVKSGEDIMEFLLNTIRLNIKTGNTIMVSCAMSLLAGIAQHRYSKAAVTNFPGIVDTVIAVANGDDVESRHQSARLLSNLAWNVKARTSFCTQECIDALITISFSDHQKLRSEAISALHLLSIESVNKSKLIRSKQGKLVQSLMRVIGPSTGEDRVRLQGFNVLLNLISRETFKPIGTHPGLIATLSTLSTSSNEPETIAALAAHCIKRLATHVHVTEQYHEELIHAIVAMSRCERKTVMQWASRAFLYQSALSGNSFYIVRDETAMQSLAHLMGYNDRLVREPALEAVVNLSEITTNAKKLASNQSLVEALVKNLNDHSCSDEPVLRRHAVRATLSLASHRASTKRIAKHYGLVEALSRYGTSTQDNDVELKRAALHGVLILAPFL